jgi:hypothetical protein
MVRIADRGNEAPSSIDIIHRLMTAATKIARFAEREGNDV